MLISILAFIAAIAIASVAAWFSIIGLIALFPGSALSIAIMAGTLEVGKLVTASWLYRNWKNTNILLKSYLVSAVVILMLITSLGVFGYLSKAYLANNAPLAAIAVEIRNYEQQLDTLTRDLTRNQQVLDQMDDAVSKLIEFSRISGPNGAIALREAQRGEREIVENTIIGIQSKIAEIQQYMLVVENASIDVKSKLGPAEYISSFIYGDQDDSVDRAVQLIILMIVLVFDPLAVLLLIAANQGFRDHGNNKVISPTDGSQVDSKNEPIGKEESHITYDELVSSLTAEKKRTSRKRKPKNIKPVDDKPENISDNDTDTLNTTDKIKKKPPSAVWIKNNKTE